MTVGAIRHARKAGTIGRFRRSLGGPRTWAERKRLRNHEVALDWEACRSLPGDRIQRKGKAVGSVLGGLAPDLCFHGSTQGHKRLSRIRLAENIVVVRMFNQSCGCLGVVGLVVRVGCGWWMAGLWHRLGMWTGAVKIAPAATVYGIRATRASCSVQTCRETSILYPRRLQQRVRNGIAGNCH